MGQYSIKDGTGTGRLMTVDSEGRAHGFATTESEEQHTNRLNSDHYLMYIDITPTGAGSEFFYIKNTDTRDMIIKSYRIWTAASDEAVDIYRNKTGTPTTTTTLTPVNLNFGSNKTATAQVYESVAFGGLSAGQLVDRLRIGDTGVDVFAEFPGGMILPQGASMTAQTVTGTVALEFTISFYYTKLADA